MQPHPRLLVSAVATLAVVLLAGQTAVVWVVEQTLDALDAAPIFDRLNAGPQASIVYDRYGHPAFAFHVEHRIVVPLDHVSRQLVAAVLAAEDRRFYQHRGVDAGRIVAAAWRDVRAREIRQGASTITQQLVRSLLLTPRRTFARKMREVYLAARLEERYDKRHILETYLNRVYFGGGYYGVEAAAHGYFGKSAADVDAAEAALLAGVLRSPSALTPRENPDGARRRRNDVLAAMRELGTVDEGVYRSAAAAPLRVLEDTGEEGAGQDPMTWDRSSVCGLYMKEEIRRDLVRRFGTERVYRGGLRIYSTLDPTLQREAERAIAARVDDLQRRSRRRADDEYDVQGALVALDPQTGDVLALVGGRDFQASPFNRATQARRQPGSAFKPFIFAAALERGYSPASVVDALGGPLEDADRAWIPKDTHDESSYTLRQALKVSSNRAAAELLREVGVGVAVDVARRMGISSELPAVPSLALGTGEVTLLELTSAYGAFADRGLLAAPVMVRRVEEQNGDVLLDETPSVRRAVSETTAFLMSSMLADVIDGGTGARARALGFRLPAAGKTGTTNDFTDAWFIGYTPRLVTGVWFGSDRPTTIMARGFAATVAVPAWAAFIKQVTRGQPPAWFDPPPGIERHAICAASGLLATPECSLPLAVATVGFALGEVESLPPPPKPPGVIEEYFAVGTAPTEYCPLHHAPPSPPAVVEPPDSGAPAPETVPTPPPPPPRDLVPSLSPPRPPDEPGAGPPR